MNPFASARRLAVRTTLLATALLLLAGLLALGTAEALAARHETARERDTMVSLLDLVAPAAREACFAGDGTMAAEVVRDLARARGVRSASLQVGGVQLAQAGPPSSEPAFSRKLWSPFNPDLQVGELSVYADHEETARQGAPFRRILRLGMLSLFGLGALAMALALHLTIFRPMDRLSEALRTGSPERPLEVPFGHGQDELGQLVAGINLRLAALGTALADQDRAQEDLRAGQRRLQAILDHAGPGLFVLDGKGTLVSWNLPFLRILGLEGAQPGTPLPPLFQAEAEQVARGLERCLKGGRPAVEVLRIRVPGPQGHLWFRLTLRPVGPDWVQGLLEPLNAQPSRTDTDREPLTGTLNRLGAERALAQALADDPDNLTLMLVGLTVADPAGAGPDLAREAALRLAQDLEPSVPLAHLGGLDFLLILRMPEDQASALGERLLLDLGRPFPLPGGGAARVGGAVGLARCAPGEEPRREVLLRRADQHLAR